jgi:hypothetical protein
MAIWFGGQRLPSDKVITYIEPISGASVRFEPQDDGSTVITLHVYGHSGNPIFNTARRIRPGDDFQEADDGAVFSVKPMPMPQPTVKHATASDLLVALIAFDPHGRQIFEVGHDGMRMHTQLEIHVG